MTKWHIFENPICHYISYKIKVPIREHFNGWGNWIRTNAHEFRAHCLTAWLYPKNSKVVVTAGYIR